MSRSPRSAGRRSQEGTDITVVAYSRMAYIAIEVARAARRRRRVRRGRRPAQPAPAGPGDHLRLGAQDQLRGGRSRTTGSATASAPRSPPPSRRAPSTGSTPRSAGSPMAEVPLPYAKPLELAALPDADALVTAIRDILAPPAPGRRHPCPRSSCPACPTPWRKASSASGTRSRATRSAGGDALVDIETDKATDGVRGLRGGRPRASSSSPRARQSPSASRSRSSVTADRRRRAPVAAARRHRSPGRRPPAAPGRRRPRSGAAARRQRRLTADRTSPLARRIARENGIDLATSPAPAGRPDRPRRRRGRPPPRDAGARHRAAASAAARGPAAAAAGRRRTGRPSRSR